MVGRGIGDSDSARPECASAHPAAPRLAALEIRLLRAKEFRNPSRVWGRFCPQKRLISAERRGHKPSDFPIWGKPFAVLPTARYWSTPIVMKTDVRVPQFLVLWSLMRVNS